MKAAPIDEEFSSEFRLRMDLAGRSRMARGRGKALQQIRDEAGNVAAYTSDEIAEISKAWVTVMPAKTAKEIQSAMVIVAFRMQTLTALEDIAERLLALEARLAEKAPGAMVYRGVWQPGTYHKGSVVTHGGSMWHADRETSTKPGDVAESWTLCCKKGRDAKEAS